MGIQPFYFDIKVPTYTYTSPLWENKEDRVSLLKLVAEEYCVESFINTVPKVGADRSQGGRQRSGSADDASKGAQASVNSQAAANNQDNSY